MSEPVSTGSDVSAGTYRCIECGEELTMQSEKSLPPCPNCNGTTFETVRGADSAQDPYPNQS